MINGQTVLAVIPARGGSKRCPRKNIREFRGKTLIQWAAEAAKKSKYIDDLFLSTEDEEMAKLAYPLRLLLARRPLELATDDASNEDVLRDVLSKMPPRDWVVLLQPTSPLRTTEDIDACIERAQMGDGCISYNRSTGHKNGAVYVAKAEWLAKHDFSHQGLMKYLMDDERSLDIDHPEQFDR